jgi:S1-C subfamily serine protease
VRRDPALAAIAAGVAATLILAPREAGAEPPRAIERVKAAIVAVGTFQRARSPAFEFRGTGFAVADGRTIVTNAHVLPATLDADKFETLAVLIPGIGRDVQLRPARRGASDIARDLVLLRMDGTPLPALAVRDSETVREGDSVLFTGFPIGSVLGPFPATHRGMIAAITPIAIPPANANQLDPATIRRLAGGAFPVFQLDATAYPGSSGSPLYSPDTGDVVGVVNMVFVKGTKEAALTQPSGITYAIPSRYLIDLLKRGAALGPR